MLPVPKFWPLDLFGVVSCFFLFELLSSLHISQVGHFLKLSPCNIFYMVLGSVTNLNILTVLKFTESSLSFTSFGEDECVALVY